MGFTRAVSFLPPLVLAASVVAAQDLRLEPFEPTGIYARGARVGWTVTSTASDSPRRYAYVIRRNNLDVVARGALDTAARATIETRLDEPGMLFLELTPSFEGGKPVVAGAASAPYEIQPSVPAPEDYDAFWASQLRALERIPMNPRLAPGESDRPEVEYFTLRLDHVGGHNVHGQLARPRRAGRFPGLLIYQWASPPYPLQRSWVTDRAAEGWLALNVEPHDVLPTEPQAYYDALPRELKEYHAIGREDREQSYFLRMYLGARRAVEYLASRPDWDGRTLVATGTSMGGQQALCAAALDARVTAVVVHMPAGADTSGPLHGRASGYPFWPADDPRAQRTAQYFDTVNCAARVRAPALVSMGFVDTVCPPVGIFAAFNQLRGPREAVPLVDAAHNHQSTAEQQAAYTVRAAEWLSALAAGRPVPPPPTAH
jgi:cephalosporin-C deacetylase-like acetyl esterase